jgi:capsular exopolysaccharide synthesis family protein
VYDFLGTLVRGWRLIAVCVGMTLALAIIYLAMVKPGYQASAHILVLQHGGRPIHIDNGATNHAALLQTVDGYSNSLATHVLIIRSPIVVEGALAAADLKNLSVDSVLKKLAVKVPDESARVLEITYRSESRDEARRVVDSVIKSYERFLLENYQRNSSEVLSLISKARDEMSEELKKLEKEYLDYRRQSTGPVTDGEGRTFIARRLDQWDQAITQATLRSLQLKSQLELGRTLAEDGVGVDMITGVIGHLTGTTVTPARADSGPSTGFSWDRLEDQISEIAFRRQTAGRVLEHLRAEQAMALSSARERVSDAELTRAFYAVPEVARCAADLGRAQAGYNQAKKISRRAQDPSVVAMGKRTRDLEAELDRLWQQLSPVLLDGLAGGDGQGIRQAAGEVVALGAKEAALRERRDQLQANRLLDLRAKHDRLVQQHGRGHAKVQAVQEQIARLEGDANEAPADPGQAQVAAFLKAVEQGLKSVEEVRAEVTRRLENDLAESKKAEIGLLTEANLRNNLERQRALFFSVVDQLRQAQLVSDFGTVTAQVLNPPAVTESRVSVALSLLVAFIAGCGLGSGAVYVVAQVDPRVHSVPEIRRLIRLRVLGQFMQLPHEQPGAGAVGILCHAEPQSGLAESCKSIRTLIDVLRRNWDGKVLLVSSPQPGEGKSITASNLAISLAQSGRKVLLVDADLRHPSLHQLHGLPRRTGLTHVLADHLPLCRAVQPTPIENLDLLAAGPDAPHPAELLATQRLGTFVAEARQAYEIVIIDSSPLLAVTDPSLIGAVSDGIVLVVRVSVTRRPEAEQTLELLGTLGTTVLGVVINGVKPGRLGYRYRYPYGRTGARSDEGPAEDEPPEPPSGTAGLPAPTAVRDLHEPAGGSGDPMS